MAQSRKLSRTLLILVAAGAVAAALAAAFWPRATAVDLARVTRTDLTVTIDEEGRTLVREAYVLSTPVTGRLLRVQVHPGDPVISGETVVAQMRPTNPAVLDLRTREQARAAVDAAQAALRVAEAGQSAAAAAADLTAADLKRSLSLFESGIASRAALDRAQSADQAARANLDTATAAIAVRQAELANARANLISFDSLTLSDIAGGGNGDEFPLLAPIDGHILRILQESETTLPAGSPIMEIGNIETDLEVLVELISSDAVQVSIGDPVLLEDWGGPLPLRGEVRRIYPFGVTKHSALGVEEQRVTVEVTLLSPPEERAGLGHGYRLKARIVIWQAPDVLTVPASALFRQGEGWAAFVVNDGHATLRPVTPGQSNGITTEVIAGLTEGETVVLYPSSTLTDGAAVIDRREKE